ncbi:efflux RND transporter periplasmic adaptor subunit [Paraglaciecola chathamensis]|jgi:RND family efflux transporter MFP subunit|uniref:Membrane protein n=2 Tax=Paraglaciecola chathamensis TaxID=368405 RepID=A0A8H9I882_9ALTE|nr:MULTISPECIES: efflux RND transporter periplasmic adaptor subunit [Paraglaciecola]AEE22412.1 efflux transporter, RND family, MFP subunit [Glaciecola sp. 4H-3-7+YE-5]MBN23608.1 efflux RND transporter periplasmic adaptor subunit [Alteromonadaceae bacterium]MBU3017482.1 efflux RND transporter periplasmic adaptor subunit [Paraglaciecola agarilytica]GAC09281.1 membrane-fusion protein [Paraglaciecola chathamensis S18K6]GGZ55003.1 membrane protein [Paraglaciecola oceanifecundans]|tara:strand:- start:21110 stop:22165 length:1056 start_codon:yes stop_codon:yes gene_type:complete
MKSIVFSTHILALLLLQACTPNIEHRPKPPLILDTIEVSAPVDTQFRRFNGQVVAPELTPLAFRLEGEIVDVKVQEGDVVEKGQVLAVLDDSRLVQTLNDAQARLDLTARQLERGKELRTREMLSSSELDELQANYKLAVANAKLAEVQLGYTRLKAPVDGIISVVSKQDFERTDAGETVVSIYQSSEVYVEISVSDTVLTRLKPLLSVPNYRPLGHFSGHKGQYPLNYLEHTSELDPESQTYQFWLKMPQVNPKILPGTNVQVSIDMVKAQMGLLQGFELPMTAIDSAEQHGQFRVWKIQDNQAVATPVEVSQVKSNGAIVLSGIREGDVIANSNLRKLRQGMTVQGATQ